MVFQQFNLFPHLSVLENLCLAPQKVLGQSAQESRETASFYLNKVGLSAKAQSYPDQLSGGQKQRVAIARTILKDPRIVIFDEATSALDSESEFAVKKALDTAMEGRTVIQIAHRLSTIQQSDRIAVLKHGVIKEIGSYSDLIEREDGHFRELMKRQLVD